MGTFDSSGAFMPMKVGVSLFLFLIFSVLQVNTGSCSAAIFLKAFKSTNTCSWLLNFLITLYQKGGKETILEEELEFKGIEEEEEEESPADVERSSAEGDKDKGEEKL